MRNVLFCVFVAIFTGCTAERLITHIDSQPPGARIEANENAVGTTPCDVALPQKGEHHRLRERVIVKAYPPDGSQGQYPQERFLSFHQEAPARLLFIMTNPPPAPPPEPQNRSGLRLSEAREKSVKIQPGMSQDAVRELLGSPDETSAGTYGQNQNTGHPWQVLNITTGSSNNVEATGGNTAHPWQGVTWTYRWEQGGSVWKLSIVFQHDEASWDVNSWNWY
jgi:hypothetical protein